MGTILIDEYMQRDGGCAARGGRRSRAIAECARGDDAALHICCAALIYARAGGKAQECRYAAERNDTPLYT